MGIIFFGASSFAVPALRRVATSVDLVVSQPDRPSGRGLKPQPSDLKRAAIELDLPVETPESCRAADFLDLIRTRQPSLIVTAAYGQIMPLSLLEIPAYGAVNLHGSILPRYRGAAPIQRAIMDGETQTGVTLMKMAKGMDTGDIISLATTPIDPDETYGSLHDRLANLAADLLSEWINRLITGSFSSIAQDHALATHAAKITKEETTLSLQETGKVAYDRFRGLSPRPGAFLETQFGRLKIIEARLWGGNDAPGKIVQSDAEIGVAFASQGLVLKTVQSEGKRPLSAKDWLNGAHLKLGQSLI